MQCLRGWTQRPTLISFLVRSSGGFFTEPSVLTAPQKFGDYRRAQCQDGLKKCNFSIAIPCLFLFPCRLLFGKTRHCADSLNRFVWTTSGKLSARVPFPVHIIVFLLERQRCNEFSAQIGQGCCAVECGAVHATMLGYRPSCFPCLLNSMFPCGHFLVTTESTRYASAFLPFHLCFSVFISGQRTLCTSLLDRLCRLAYPWRRPDCFLAQLGTGAEVPRTGPTRVCIVGVCYIAMGTG